MSDPKYPNLAEETFDKSSVFVPIRPDPVYSQLVPAYSPSAPAPENFGSPVQVPNYVPAWKRFPKVEVSLDERVPGEAGKSVFGKFWSSIKPANAAEKPPATLKEAIAQGCSVRELSDMFGNYKGSDNKGGIYSSVLLNKIAINDFQRSGYSPAHLSHLLNYQEFLSLGPSEEHLKGKFPGWDVWTFSLSYQEDWISVMCDLSMSLSSLVGTNFPETEIKKSVLGIENASRMKLNKEAIRHYKLRPSDTKRILDTEDWNEANSVMGLDIDDLEDLSDLLWNDEKLVKNSFGNFVKNSVPRKFKSFIQPESVAKTVTPSANSYQTKQTQNKVVVTVKRVDQKQ